APVADFAGVGRELVVTAYQSANGIVNLINPTFAAVMGALAIGRVPYERWLAFMSPLRLILTVIIMACLSVAVLIRWRMTVTQTYGVHSEVGKLRRVLVHRPGTALARLTPRNREELLFDDVIWVKQARVEHMTFVDAMRYRGVEVVFLRELLAETMRIAEA